METVQPVTHRGVTYYRTLSEAERIQDTIPGSRIVIYTRGYAVQLYRSGPYYNEHAISQSRT